MLLRDDGLSVSPTDLSYFLSCRHRTALELAVAHGVRTKPAWKDPLLEALFELGLRHEREYVESLRSTSARLVDLSGERKRDVAAARTLQAMHDGADVIVQAALVRDRWYGRPDVLLKTDAPSPRLGSWSYEPADTKLARETRGGTILQLGLYCELIESAQGGVPSRFHVITPGDVMTGAAGVAEVPNHSRVITSYRFRDYAAYFRLLKDAFETAITFGYDALAAANYPDPVDHCDICPWILDCRDRRRADDHLSLVAGISRLQRRELTAHDLTTMAALAALEGPMPWKLRGSVETYDRVRDQARLQVESRRLGHVVYELIPPPAPPAPTNSAAAVQLDGLARLPAPSAGDVFLDLEGDALAGENGREYLFGIVTVDESGLEQYRAWWADTTADERRSFEEVVDLLVARRAAFPDMHVYHYAPYEPSALKRLMGRYASREREIDELLRGRRFVDLYAVVRQGIRAGVERYSIKNLEPLYDYTRDVDLRDAGRALRVMEQALELNCLDAATPGVRDLVERYNRDDCVSTRRLRDWLEARREDLIATGTSIERPPLVPGESSRELDEKARAVEALRARLLAGIPDPAADRSDEQQARYLLAYLLDWHRREDKAEWWEYFRLAELPEDDLLEEPRALARLHFSGDLEKIKKSYVQRYVFDQQECEIRVRDDLKTQDGRKFGSVVRIDRESRTVDLLVGPGRMAERPTALFAHKHFAKDDIEASLFALGQQVADASSVQALAESPARAILLRETPKLTSASFAPPRDSADSAVPQYAVSIVTDLDRTTLAIQGPPGSGKTFTGARMICALLKQGKRVGVVGPSHKVIRNLLDAVLASADRPGLDVRIGHKNNGEDDEAPATAGEVTSFDSNDSARQALSAGDVNVLGGTAWMWSRPDFENAVDVLFVDEAGQMSLANVLGIARAAGSLVLLGDPRQLDQPMKGSHPEGVDVSALQHVLGEAETMPPDRGLFLPITFRLAPAVCSFTSELFYAGELKPKPGLERQAIAGTGPLALGTSISLDGAGLRLVTVDHDGNRTSSPEEARAVVLLVRSLLSEGSCWMDEMGASRSLAIGDICVVAPFNAHVARIKEEFSRAEKEFAWATPTGVPRVGTVDKFQGQQAPVVIYSMATSRPEDAPRGMEFLYSLNRLNVATSRAQCLVVLVVSPALLTPDCRSPRQMRLANALCRYREIAPVIAW